jgi:hypothetical protein
MQEMPQLPFELSDGSFGGSRESREGLLTDLVDESLEFRGERTLEIGFDFGDGCAD